MLPAGNGPGFSCSQPAFTQVNHQHQNMHANQMLPYQTMSQPLMPNNNHHTPQHGEVQQQSQQIQKTPYYYRMSSTSDDEPETSAKNPNGWQQVKNIKRRKINTSQAVHQNIDITSNNRFNVLSIDESGNQINLENKIPKPPPIFIYGVTDYKQMIKKLTEVVEEEQYSTKSMADNNIKINCNTPETYRTLVNFLKENNIIHHTYQLKEERAYRVVIKHLHYSVDTKEIEDQLTQMGHKVRNIINGRSRVTKQPLNLFLLTWSQQKTTKMCIISI